jgi:superfamily I DNA and/or RNA helicase
MHDQVAMLTDNYRGHPAIVHIVNVAYDDKLIPAAPADPIFRHSSLRVTIPNAKKLSSGQETRVLHIIKVSNSCPVTFLHHNGQESREHDSPSWLNITEAEMIISAAFDLHERHGVPLSDIAIISPYRKQVGKITEILKNKLHIRDIHDFSIPCPSKCRPWKRFKAVRAAWFCSRAFAIIAWTMSKRTRNLASVF